MKRLLGTVLCCWLAASCSGCALCYTPYDDHYNAFGGVVERQDRVHGRVGSILSDSSIRYMETDAAGGSPTETDLYLLEANGPELEMIEPQSAPGASILNDSTPGDAIPGDAIPNDVNT